MSSRTSSVGLRAFAWRWQRRCCMLCGMEMRKARYKGDPFGASEEHVRPRVRGYGREGNMALTHWQCNYEKGARRAAACEIMYAVVLREAYDLWEEFRQRMFVATHLQELCDRTLHGIRLTDSSDARI